MWLRESYLIWVEKRLRKMMRTHWDDDKMHHDSGEDEDELQHQRDINIITCSQDSDKQVRYSLAKRPPLQNLTVEKITRLFGTTNFLPALSTFLRRNMGTTITPSLRDHFDVYRQILISLPNNRYLGEHALVDKVRTAPSVNASGRASEKAAHFDTAFVVEDLSLYKSEGGLSGMWLFSSL